MIPAGLPSNEADRLAALTRYQILDTPPEANFDGLVKLAAHLLSVPIALISFLATDRQWFKARYGMDVPETARDISFCAHVAMVDAPIVVLDAQRDERFLDSPLVMGGPLVRFYVGVPLRTPDGFVLGTLCCIDHVAREVTAQQVAMLELLANQILALLELRRQQLQAAAIARTYEREKAALLTMLDGVPALVAYWDRQMRNVYSNAKYLEYFGISSQSLRGRHILDFFAEAQITGNESYVQAVLEGKRQTFETAVPDAAGTRRQFLVNYEPDVLDGELKGFIVLASDVTARNDSARALLRSQLTSRALLDALPGSFLHLSHDGYVSAIYGRQDHALLRQTELVSRRHWSEIFTDSVVTQIAPHFDQSVASSGMHEGAEILEFCVPKEAAVCHYEARLVRVPYSSDRICLILDITAKRQQEQILRDYSQRLAAVIHAAPDGILILDENGKIEQASPMIERLCGYPESELLSKHIKMLIPTAAWETLEAAEEAPLADAKVTRWHEAALLRKDGTETATEIALSRFEFGGRRHCTAIVRDISERELMRARSQFIAMVSHELRAPLNAVVGLGETLLEEPVDALSAQQRARVSTMLDSAQHLSSLVTDILDLSRIELGMLRLALRECPIVAICDRTVAMITDASEHKQIRLTRHYESGDEVILADSRRVTQILVNLLDNAIKFTPHGGYVTLSTRCRGPLVEFEIADSGIGIAEADHKQLFRPFSQIDATARRQYQGTGLGLYLARRLALLHGGDISVKSEPGLGSKFTLSLPRRSHSSESIHG